MDKAKRVRNPNILFAMKNGQFESVKKCLATVGMSFKTLEVCKLLSFSPKICADSKRLEQMLREFKTVGIQ